jgi:hypothetical protein
MVNVSRVTGRSGNASAGGEKDIEDTGLILPPIISGEDFAEDPKVCWTGDER